MVIIAITTIIRQRGSSTTAPCSSFWYIFIKLKPACRFTIRQLRRCERAESQLPAGGPDSLRIAARWTGPPSSPCLRRAVPPPLRLDCETLRAPVAVAPADTHTHMAKISEGVVGKWRFRDQQTSRIGQSNQFDPSIETDRTNECCPRCFTGTPRQRIACGRAIGRHSR